MYSPITNTRVTLKVAAELLKKDLRTIQAAFERKEIRGYKAPKKGIMLQKSSVLRYAKEKNISLTPRAASDLKVTPSGRKLGVARKAKKVKSAARVSAPKRIRKPKAAPPVTAVNLSPLLENVVPA